MEAVKDSLFGAELVFPDGLRSSGCPGYGRFGRSFRHLHEDTECPGQLGKEVAGDVGHCFQGRWLELFEAGVIKDLAYGALHRSSANPWRHHRAFVGDNMGLNVLLDKRFRVVFLKLVLIHLQ